jgi:hypothetical protein
MNLRIKFLPAVALMLLAGCAPFRWTSVTIGEPEPEVIAKLGNPTHHYQAGSDHLLEYMHGPMGQVTYMARIDAQGRLVSYEQVLTTQKFMTIKPGEARKEDVLRTIGAPSETAFYTLSQLEAWSYPYKENGAWDSMMTVYFDRSGAVRKLENGPDPRRMPDGRGRHR